MKKANFMVLQVRTGAAPGLQHHKIRSLFNAFLSIRKPEPVHAYF